MGSALWVGGCGPVSEQGPPWWKGQALGITAFISVGSLETGIPTCYLVSPPVHHGCSRVALREVSLPRGSSEVVRQSGKPRQTLRERGAPWPELPPSVPAGVEPRPPVPRWCWWWQRAWLTSLPALPLLSSQVAFPDRRCESDSPCLLLQPLGDKSRAAGMVKREPNYIYNIKVSAFVACCSLGFFIRRKTQISIFHFHILTRKIACSQLRPIAFGMYATIL